MHRSAELLAALSRASGAVAAKERHQINNARRPIDVWRASPAGQRAEDGLRTAMANEGAARREMLSQFLTAFAADVPAYIEGLLRHARAHPEWQPPFNDFTALGQHGLHLIENATFRLSLLAVEALPNTAPPPVVRFGDGEVLFCAAAADADLSFHQWQLTEEHCSPCPARFFMRALWSMPMWRRGACPSPTAPAQPPCCDCKSTGKARRSAIFARGQVASCPKYWAAIRSGGIWRWPRLRR